MVMVVCSSCSVKGVLKVIDNSSIGVKELLWYASMKFFMRERHCVALEAGSVAPCTALLPSVHWLYVYLHKVRMNVLVHWVGWKVLFGALYYICVSHGRSPV